MKSLLLFLLLLNILYALWQLQDGRAGQTLREAADAPLETGLPIVERPAGAERVGAPLQPATTLCVNLGVFAERARAEQLRQRLLALDIQSAVVAREVPDSADYWLVMPVAGGRVEALSRLSALQEQGVDSFLISQGRLANNLSLGVFSREDYARARQAQLQAMGHEVQVELREKVASQFVVEVDSAARRLVDQALLARLRADFPGLQHQYHPCAGGAPSGNVLQ